MHKTALFIQLLLLLINCNSNREQLPENYKKNYDTSILEKSSGDKGIVYLDTPSVDAKSEGLEKKIVDKIVMLPEYVKTKSYIDSLTNHKKEISFIMATGPIYEINIGYYINDYETEFAVYYQIVIKPKNLEIIKIDNRHGEVWIID